MTAPDAIESALCLRVIDALLRENVHGIRDTAEPTAGPDGEPRLRLRSGARTAQLPVRIDGFLCDVAAGAPYLDAGDILLDTLDAILDFAAARADPADAEGFTAFAAECRAALAAERLQLRHRPAVFAELPLDPRGLSGALAYDTLAAHRDHPAYPTGRARIGLTDDQLQAYAPEFGGRFALRWAALPHDAVTIHGELPAPWPIPSAVGLPAGLDATHTLLPVHPLTDPAALAEAAPDLHYAPKPCLTVAPTLSMRSVALLDDPATHLKMPLATSTLGLRNRRTIKPGSLDDGAAGDTLLRLVRAAEPRFRDRILLADEQTYGHAGHELLAFLVRRLPNGLDDASVVTVAALAAPGRSGRSVAEDLADTYFGGDPVALYDAYLRLLFDWHVTLWLRYGIALEAHQQNTALVLDRPGGRTRLRLLLKDNDGPRLVPARVRARLGAAADRAVFADPRIAVADGLPLADMFTTIVLHLCAAAPLFAFAATGGAPASGLRKLLRTRLAEAAAPHASAPDHALLRDHVLDADRLPVKLMVTAGTLLDKSRSGAADINKHYARTGPNYLRAAGSPTLAHAAERIAHAG